MTGSRYAIALGFGLLVLGLAGAAQAQEDLSAGKTPAQLFQLNCSACHNSPRGLASAGEKAGGLFGGLDNFLAQHYTASGRSAQIIADYLKSVGGAAPTARRASHRRTGKPGAKTDIAKKGEKSDKAKTGDAQAETPKAEKSKTEKSKTEEPKSEASKPDAAEKTGAASAKPKSDKPKSDKAATGEPKGAGEKSKPAAASSQAKREKPVPTDKKTD